MNKTALPTKLSFHAPNLREQIEALPEGTALIGLSTHGDAIAVDLTGECPHVLVIDPKRISHLWARGLPTVTHRGNVAGIHDALVGLGEELARRLDLNDSELDAAPRLIVSVDSAYSALRQLTRYWETFRGKDDPHTSPAVSALEAALWTGRAARVHVILDGTPAPGVLGAAPHEMFGTVILARVTTTTWQRLAPLAGPAPKPSRLSGRSHVIQEDEAHETQAIWMTDADVVNWLTDPQDPEN